MTGRVVLLGLFALTICIIYSLKDMSFHKLQSIWNDPNSGPTVIFGTIFGALFLFGIIYFSFHDVIKSTIQSIRYGRGTLKFRRYLKSGSTGEFSIHLSRKLKLSKIKVTFLCQKVVTGRSESLQNMVEKEEILWSDVKEVSINENGASQISFDVPGNLPRTKSEYPKIEWLVQVEEIGSVSSPYEVTFFVPVSN